MKGKSKQIWLEKGYGMISQKGFTNVNVESIARTINKNKSSFYHYFGDWDGYEESLLTYHLNLAEEFALKLNGCQHIIPDMVDIFLEHKTDIFFHKQLRINRDRPHFKKCFESVFNIFEKAILEKWKSFLMLENHSFLAAKILALLSENFLLKITYENYTQEWMYNYLLEVVQLVDDINSRSRGDIYN